jgi:hypothetical protein
MINEKIINDLISFCVNITSIKDAWTITGEIRYKENPESAIIIISSESRINWLKRKLVLIRKNLKNFNEKDLSGDRNGLQVRVIVLENNMQFGVSEALYSVSHEFLIGTVWRLLKRHKTINVKEPWCKYGYLIEDGVLYFVGEDNKKLGDPLVIPDAMSFWNLFGDNVEIKIEKEIQKSWNKKKW